MRKLLILAIFVIVLGLFGCVRTFYYDYVDLEDTVEKVEVIEITNLGKTVEDFKSIRTLNEEEIDDFIQELAKIEFVYPFGDPYDFKDGIAFKISFTNQEYEILSELTTKRYRNNDEISWRQRNCSKEEFDRLISKYLN